MLHCLQCTRVREIKPAHAKSAHHSLVLISLISFLHGSHSHLSSRSMLMQKLPHFCCRNSSVLSRGLWRHQPLSHGTCSLHLESSAPPTSRFSGKSFSLFPNDLREESLFLAVLFSGHPSEEEGQLICCLLAVYLFLGSDPLPFSVPQYWLCFLLPFPLGSIQKPYC